MHMKLRILGLSGLVFLAVVAYVLVKNLELAKFEHVSEELRWAKERISFFETHSKLQNEMIGRLKKQVSEQGDEITHLKARQLPNKAINVKMIPADFNDKPPPKRPAEGNMRNNKPLEPHVPPNPRDPGPSILDKLEPNGLLGDQHKSKDGESDDVKEQNTNKNGPEDFENQEEFPNIDLSAVAKVAVEDGIEQLKTMPCKTVPVDVLSLLGRFFLKIEQKSRFYLCEQLYEHLHLNYSLLKFQKDLLEEEGFNGVNYRFYLRDRVVEVVSSHKCSAGFGGETSFVGKGVYGFTYRRCMHPDCLAHPSAIIKLASMREPNATTTDASFISAEVTTNNLLSPLVEQNANPHIAISYTSYVCKEVLKTNLLANKTFCDSRKEDHPNDDDDAPEQQEDLARCKAFGKISSGVASAGLQIIVQEEVEINLKEFSTFVLQYPAAMQAQIWRGALFQVVYGVYALQRAFKGFRHNDLSWSNIRVTIPKNALFERGDTYRRHGFVDAPMDAHEEPTSHWTYIINKTEFYVPNYGFAVRLSDFDFVWAEHAQLQNIKVTELDPPSPCGVPRRPEHLRLECLPVLEIQAGDGARAMQLRVAPSNMTLSKVQADTDVLLAFDALSSDFWAFRISHINSSLLSLFYIGNSTLPSLSPLPSSVCLFSPMWYSIAKIERDDNSGSERKTYPRFNLYLDPPSPPLVPGSILMIKDNPSVLNGQFRIVRKRASVDAFLVESKYKLSRHPDIETASGGYSYVTGSGKKRELFGFAYYGIAPVKNDKFDLHYLFNIMYTHFKKPEHKPHPEVFDFMLQCLPSSELRGTEGRLIYKYRMSDIQGGYWCNDRGELTDSDPRLRSIPTPEAMLSFPYFAPLRHRSNQSRQIGEVIQTSNLKV